MKVLSVIGARPQFIKAAAVSRALREADIAERVLHTGQHYDATLSQVFFDELAIPRPDINLGVGSGSHATQTGAMLVGIEKALESDRPECVLIYGDTNSTMAGALAAAKLSISIAHVEAGLRSYNRAMPEEINRIVADALSDRLFAPTETAVYNLLREGVAKTKIDKVGDVMYDVALQYGERAEVTSRIVERLDLSPKGFVLATIHRAENTDDPIRLGAVFEGLCEVAAKIPVVVPLHPRTRKALQASGLLDVAKKRLRIIEPVGFLDMVRLERNAAVIGTDSGGVQKEAFFYRVPCVTLRDETEWVELVDAGWNTLTRPTNPQEIASTILARIGTSGLVIEPFGDGHASQRIAAVLSRSH